MNVRAPFPAIHRSSNFYTTAQAAEEMMRELKGRLGYGLRMRIGRSGFLDV